jgi:hypothetical protein
VDGRQHGPASGYAALIMAYNVARLTLYSLANAVLLSLSARWRILAIWSALSLAEWPMYLPLARARA